MASPMLQLRSRKVKNNLRTMFEILDMNMNTIDSDRFKTQLLMSGFLTCWKKGKESQFPRKLLKCDSYTFFRFLEDKGHIDDTHIHVVQDTIKAIKPELYELATCDAHTLVEEDPVVKYLEMTAPLQPHKFYVPHKSHVPSRRSERLKRHKAEDTSEKIDGCLRKKAKITEACVASKPTSYPAQCHQSHSCDLRLRVKVEYVDHQEVLGNSVHSHKQHEMERQFDMFNQASTILKSRDLGTVVCDIKFSDLTSLDAFWRDYTNGALLEALKVVFITESLNEAVGHEPLRLLVSVDEDNYRNGRVKLLKNFTG